MQKLFHVTYTALIGYHLLIIWLCQTALKAATLLYSLSSFLSSLPLCSFLSLFSFRLIFFSSPYRSVFSSSFLHFLTPLTCCVRLLSRWKRQPMSWRICPHLRPHCPRLLPRALPTARLKTKECSVRRKRRRRRTAAWPRLRTAPPPTSLPPLSLPR